MDKRTNEEARKEGEKERQESRAAGFLPPPAPAGPPRPTALPAVPSLQSPAQLWPQLCGKGGAQAKPRWEYKTQGCGESGTQLPQANRGPQMLTSCSEPLTPGSSRAPGAPQAVVNRHPPAARANTGLHECSPSLWNPLGSSCCWRMLDWLVGADRAWQGHPGVTLSFPGLLLAERPVAHHHGLPRVTAPRWRIACSCLMAWHKPERA